MKSIFELKQDLEYHTRFLYDSDSGSVLTSTAHLHLLVSDDHKSGERAGAMLLWVQPKMVVTRLF
jgi:hypothetical protein